MKKVIYIDTETTGLCSIKNALTEIACIVEINGEIKEQLLLKINPYSYNKAIEVEEKALEITNKIINDLENYPKSNIQFMKFLEFLDSYVDVFNKEDKFIINGYNTKFDVDFIKEWFKDHDNKYYGKYFSYKELDVFALVKYLKHLNLISTKSDKLLTICQHFGIKLNAHNALDDIVATKELNDLLSKRYINDIERYSFLMSEDKLAKLETMIEQFFIKKHDYVTNGNWGFTISINNSYKNKSITVSIWNESIENEYVHFASGSHKTVKEMYLAAFNIFGESL